MKILAFISYFIPKPLSPELWDFLPKTIVSYERFPLSLIEDILPFIDNMITRDPQNFSLATFNGISYLELLWKMILFILDRENDEVEGAEAAKLLEVIFQNLRGQIDFLVGQTLSLLAKRLSSSENLKFKILLYAVLGNVLYYNAQLSLSHMQQCDLFEPLLGTLLFSIEQGTLIRRIYDNKQVSLGLSSILQIPYNQLPEGIKPLIPKIILLNVMTLNKINEKIVSKDPSKEKERADEKDFEGESLFVPHGENFITAIRQDDEDDENEAIDDENEAIDDDGEDGEDDDDDDGGDDRLKSILNEIKGEEDCFLFFSFFFLFFYYFSLFFFSFNFFFFYFFFSFLFFFLFILILFFYELCYS
jgi:hypothetical protein